VVVVAAGASSRMGGVDKLMAPVCGRPLLAWAVDALAETPRLGRLVVVAAAERVAELVDAPWIRARGALIVAGGRRRQESVRAGVGATDAGTVLVHDGARPLVTRDLAERVAIAAARDGAAIPAVPVAETLKRVADRRVAGTVPRAGLAVAQTPQGARRSLLEEAWSRFPATDDREFTDEAALLEAAGVPVTVVDGDPTNLKVTEPPDLARVAALLAARSGPPRVAAGHDSHPFGPADGLRLGGIEIADAPRLHGHSDGDAALHAVADALLGAAALGDLGRLFPSGDPATAGADSRRLLADVVATVADAGYRPVALDLTIVGARPRLGPERLADMRTAIAGLLALDEAVVSVKASSGNLAGPEGAGRAIAAHALATLVRR
jgi:2-C-methyl-D-erythritol 4-phosphate cytidylyltransferase/2-C-methyl-D-erythritol 2,4-cyclodiphosphate synthase